MPVRGRAALLLMAVAVALGGCEAAAGPLLAANVASIAVVGRDPAGIVASAVTGKDCNIVRSSQGLSYCAPRERAPNAPRYCTRSLGTVDCWDRPDPFGYYQREVADGPSMLSPDQDADRTSHWPKF